MNERNMLINIVLPTGTRTVTVREIPALFAKAIHPELPDNAPRQIIEIKKMPLSDDNKRQWCGEGTQAFPVRLTDDDMKSLWASLPPLNLPMNEAEWEPYAASYASANITDWELKIVKQDQKWNRLVLLDMTVEKYKDAVKIAVQKGELEPRSQLTFLPVPQASGEQLQDAFVTVENLREYAARFQVGVEQAPTLASTPDEPGKRKQAVMKGEQNTSNWKMLVQAEAAKLWKTLRRSGANPTKFSIRTDLARWCCETGVKTTTGINPSDEYIYRHALRDWTPPED